MSKDNYITGEINLKPNDINEMIRIINSYEEVKSEYELEAKEDLNEEEIKEKCTIKINGEIIPFDYYHKFDKEGKYNIEYIFNRNLIKANHLFYQCEYFTSFNLSNFKTQNTTNFRGMFKMLSFN